MTTPVQVEVPADLVPGLIGALLAVYAAQSEALHRTVERYQSGEIPFADLDAGRRALWHAEAALDTLGWAAAEQIGAGLLHGPPGLVHDVLTAAVIDAAESLADACRDYTDARRDLAALQRAFDRLAAHHALLTEHERQHGG
jgi:hypothetical protein